MSDTFRLDRRALTPESYKALKKLVDDDKVLVPVERNYEAATNELKEWSTTAVAEEMAKAVVDAALGEQP